MVLSEWVILLANDRGDIQLQNNAKHNALSPMIME